MVHHAMIIPKDVEFSTRTVQLFDLRPLDQELNEADGMLPA
jgi:hypothetical protein